MANDINKENCIPEAVVKQLIKAALEARKNAYTPYSGFKVGAALLVLCDNCDNIEEACKSGKPCDNVDDEMSQAECFDGKQYRIVTGCNIENAAYSPGNCAERTAVFKAVSEGDRNFRAIAIVAGKNDEPDAYTSPCGMCRQVLREFVCPESFQVIMAKSADDYIVKTLEELFPMSFGPDNLA